jgi:transposase
MRTMLYEAAQSMMHSKKWSWLKAWAMQIARRRGMKKAIVALARRLAVIMHRRWQYWPPYRSPRKNAAISAANAFGCSIAAKCPPFGIGVQR